MKGQDDMTYADLSKAHEAVDHAAAKLREAVLLLKRAGAKGTYVNAVRDAARAAKDAEAAMLDEVYAD